MAYAQVTNWGETWADQHIEDLIAGHTVQFRPHGRSMEPRILSGQLCTVEPVDASTLSVGDVVLCTVGCAQYVHIVKAIDQNRFQIGNNKGGINGWIGPDTVHGKLVRVEP